jgi:hypothetical protein
MRPKVGATPAHNKGCSARKRPIAVVGGSGPATPVNRAGDSQMPGVFIATDGRLTRLSMVFRHHESKMKPAQKLT